jgi:hypothetical protein
MRTRPRQEPCARPTRTLTDARPRPSVSPSLMERQSNRFSITPSRHQWHLEAIADRFSLSPALSLPLPSYKAEVAPTELSLPQSSSLPLLVFSLPRRSSPEVAVHRRNSPSPEPPDVKDPCLASLLDAKPLYRSLPVEPPLSSSSCIRASPR